MSTETILPGVLEQAKALLQARFARCDDVIFRDLRIGSGQAACLVYVDGMVDSLRVEEEMIRPLLASFEPDSFSGDDSLTSWVLYNILPAGKAALLLTEEQAVTAILRGDVILVIDGAAGCICAGMTSLKTRAIEEPATEPVIRGPRDGFTESISINLTLIRRRMRTSQLKCESFLAGKLSQTQISLVYMEGVVKPQLVEEARSRLQKVKLVMVLESGYIEEVIADNKLSIFPQMLTTERPDRAAAALAEGRIVILVDNTPFTLIAPTNSFEMLQAAEDYSQHYMAASATRWLRLWLSFSAIVFPSLYVAVTTMHQEMLPTSLLLTIAASREAVPFPAIVEAFIMEMAFEGLREAGIRLPRPVGQAVSIVGALVIGQAAVQAGLVSASLVIVVSFTGIASFIFPSYSQGLSVRLLRFPLMILAGLLGLYGILLGLLALLVHMSKLKSFGEPYMSPVAPASLRGLKDVLLRVPWWQRTKRPANE